MTNKEKYREEILDILISDACIGIDNETGELVSCSSRGGCTWCKFHADPVSCTKLRKKWFNEEYVEPKVDWSEVAIDTPILVSNNEVNWYRGYFAGFDGNFVSAWKGGAPSWSAQFDDYVTRWKYAKLAESGDVHNG